MSTSSFRADPYRELAKVREAGPLCRLEPFGFLGVTRYEDVALVMKNPRIFSSAGMEEVFPPIPGAELFSRGRVLIGTDPPDHGRVRRLIQRAFTVQEMAAWEPKVAALTSELVDRLVHRRSFDLIGDLAMPLPVAVISAMLGVDASRQNDFKRWSDDMVSVRSVQLSRDAEWRAEREAEIAQSCGEFTGYFSEVIAERRRRPDGPDLISAMVRASEGGQIIAPDEVLSLTRLMLVAGNETTTNLLGNAMTALLRSPDQWQLLMHAPELAAGATEEALRYDGPVLNLVRRVTETTEIGGAVIPEGTIVAPLLASANRDPRKFADPDRFDIRREPQGHFAFGSGIHLCVGAPLARIETRIALSQLAAKLGGLALTTAAPSWLESLTLRGHKALTLVRTTPAARSEDEREPRAETWVM